MVCIHDELQLDFEDVLIKPECNGNPEYKNLSINHRGDVDIVRKFDDLHLSGVPVMSANMTQTGTFNIAQKLLENNYFASLHKFYSANDIIKWVRENNVNTQNLFVTVGLRNAYKEICKLERLKRSGVRYNILIDMPNAAIQDAHDYVSCIRYLYPNHVIAVGNVATEKETKKLIQSGADIVKIGIGPSQVCDTRIKTGCGRPQLSAIIGCADVAHEYGRYVIADGGYKCNGDICRALVAGADICMSGSLFAGCDEAAGDIVTKYYRTNECLPDAPHTNIIKIEKFKEYYGMSSFRAQYENYGKVTKSGTSEGVESKLVPYTGPIQKTIDDINGSLRSCGTYIKAAKIERFNVCGAFYRVNRVK